MKKIVCGLLFCLLFAVSSICMANPLPNSEFSLGGLCVGTGCTLDYAESIYGEPEYVSGGDYKIYRYGSSVVLKGWTDRSGTVHINYVAVTSNNGWATPAGLTVGMDISVAKKLYGYEKTSYSTYDGMYETMFPHMGSGAGAGMFVYSNSRGTIKKIEVIN